ncbi:MAG: hypothetical protein AAFO75_01525 [Pseudomonadota bacterium]
MSDPSNASEEIAKLKKEVTELSGLALATGVILTQLLQTTCKRELNPQQAAGAIVDSAREGIEAFAKQNDSDPAMKKRALEAVTQYEDQIRSVLAV